VLVGLLTAESIAAVTVTTVMSVRSIRVRPGTSRL
jgi:hypothetical protein